MNVKLIAGLGNPGEKYKKTRHNAGFLALEEIAAAFQFPVFKMESRFNAEISESIIGGQKIILAKPQTFMNKSGNAVKAICDYYKIGIANIIVIHDDLDIELGKYKIARDRTSAGHKGVQSIIDTLGTKNFTRVRIGIGVENKPLDSSPAGESLGASKIPAEKFVLENFSKVEEKTIDEVIGKVSGEIEILIKKLKNIH